MKVTPRMVGSWVKAVFLVIIGIVLLLYADKMVDELREFSSTNLEVAFDEIWTLMTILLWILVAWLFVAAALTVALSFSEHRYSLLDVMKRLAAIERKLGIPPAKEIRKAEEELVEEPVVESPPVEEEPPPP